MNNITKLTNREKEIIQILINNKGFIPVKVIAEQLKISEKTTYRDIDKIESKFSSCIFLKKQGKGIKLINEDIAKLDNSVHNIKKYSVEERRIKIFLWLLQHSKEYTSIYDLSDEYYVGRTSIISDLNYIESHLLGKHLNLEKNKKGTRIIGKEEDIRSKIIYIFENYSFVNLDKKEELYSSNRIEKNTLKAMQDKYPLKDIEKIENIIKIYERNLPYTISNVYYTNMIVHILIAIERIKLKKYVDENTFIKNIDDFFYKQANNIAIELEKEFNIKFPKQEITYIYKYLTSTGVGKLNTIDSKKWIDEQIDNKAKTFIQNMLKDNIVDLSKNEQVYYAFQLHIRALMQRIEYRIEIKNPITNEIKITYPDVFNYMKNTAQKLLDTEISDDEIAYLTVYMQYLFEKKQEIKKVVIVCHSGFGTSILLKKRLLANFENIDVVDILSSEDLETYDLNNIDFIISTVNLSYENNENIIYVSTFLLKEDIENINNKLFGGKNEYFKDSFR